MPTINQLIRSGRKGKEKTVGILYFDTRCKANAFSEGDLKFVTEVALLMSPVLPEPPDDTKPIRRPGIY